MIFWILIGVGYGFDDVNSECVCIGYSVYFILFLFKGKI